MAKGKRIPCDCNLAAGNHYKCGNCGVHFPFFWGEECQASDCERIFAERVELSKEIARVTSHDPCIIIGCLEEYGHEGKHRFED